MAGKQVVIIGAGKIGRGYLAELFQIAGYHITFLAHSPEQTEEMRSRGKYPIFRLDKEGNHVEVEIAGYDVFCVETEYDACICALCNTKYVLLPIYPTACAFIGHMIGDAICKRVAENNENTLDVILCVNFLQATKMISGYIKERLSTEAQKTYFKEKVGIVEGLVSRLVVAPTKEMLAEDPLAVSAGYGDTLPVDADAFKGKPPLDINIVLLDKLPARFTYKIWVTNMMHFAVSLYGDHMGYTYVREAARDPYIIQCVRLAEKESALAVMYEYNLDREGLRKMKEGMQRDPWSSWIDPASNDMFARVVRDMKRKLSKSDRVIGPALACVQGGKVPYFLSKVAALALLYYNPQDATCVELKQIIDTQGPGKALEVYGGLRDEVAEENRLKQLILGQYYALCEKDPLDIAY